MYKEKWFNILEKMTEDITNASNSVVLLKDYPEDSEHKSGVYCSNN